MLQLKDLKRDRCVNVEGAPPSHFLVKDCGV